MFTKVQIPSTVTQYPLVTMMIGNMVSKEHVFVCALTCNPTSLAMEAKKS
jgi:hypothetical protein